MKKFIVSCCLLVAFGFLYLNFKAPQASTSLAEVRETHYHNLQAFQAQSIHFQQLANSFDASEASVAELQAAHLANRLAFKKIELFVGYYDEGAMLKHLNGAPLPKPEPAVAEVLVMEPTGLQVLDELVFSETPFAEKEAIQSHANKLVNAYKKIAKAQRDVNMTHRHVFEAARQELVRIFTLGVTGFDTPGSVNALPEAAEALQSTASTIAAYYPLIRANNNELVEETATLFQQAVQYLDDNDDFDTFNRLHFLRTYINPLYKNIYHIHIASGVETVKEVNPLLMPFNYEATNLFDLDFLNTTYFAKLDWSHTAKQQRIELGKLLFFDPILSSTNERSCASCHHPDKAFTDNEVTSLATADKGRVQRNSPTLLNAVFAAKYFYDLRGLSLEKQTKHVIFDEKEFDSNFIDILGKIKESDEYQQLFKTAYADQPQYALSPATITNALAYYVASLQTWNSPFDQYVRGESEDLSEEAKLGFNLFMGKAACGTCHFAPTFNGSVPPLYEESESEVLGVPATAANEELDDDLGRAANQFPRDQVEFYIHSFKTVTVRNAALTAPYMHNGVYETLEEVVDFYNKGGGAGMGIEVPHQTLPDAHLNLNDEEQQALIAFMNALTDKSSIEKYKAQTPTILPAFTNRAKWNQREVGGVY